MVEQTPELVKQSDEHGNTLLAIACQNNRKVGGKTRDPPPPTQTWF